jgi:hypothetical protein
LLSLPSVIREAIIHKTIDSIMSVSNNDEPHSARYISVPKAVQLIPKPFKGNPLELREFIQNVEATYEVVDPSD